MPKLHKEIMRLVPPLVGDERQGLKDSISAVGVLHPAVLWTDHDGQDWIIDGRNRWELVEELAAEGKKTADNDGQIWPCPTTEYRGDELDAVLYSIHVNRSRRGLSSSQLAVVAVRGGVVANRLAHRLRGAELKTWQAGNDDATVADIAKASGTNRTYLWTVLQIERSAPDLNDKVLQGSLRLPAAKKLLDARLAAAAAGQDDAPATVDDREAKTVEECSHDVLDGLHRPVQQGLHQAFAARKQFSDLAKRLKEIHDEVELLAVAPGGRWLAIQHLLADLKVCRANIRSAQPHAPCPRCGGDGKDPVPPRPCTMCKGCGYLDKPNWDRVPESERTPA